MKYLMVLAVIAAIVLVYVLLSAEQPAINDLIETANLSANWTGFKETQAAVNSFPIYIWAIPGLVGLVAIVYYLKFWNRGA
jgi:hypothetical protein